MCVVFFFYIKKVSVWYYKHQFTAILVVLLAFTRVDVLDLLHSRIFRSKKQGDAFHAPFPERSVRRIKLGGLIGFLEY